MAALLAAPLLPLVAGVGNAKRAFALDDCALPFAYAIAILARFLLPSSHDRRLRQYQHADTGKDRADGNESAILLSFSVPGVCCH
jgi:hypothetical protein